MSFICGKCGQIHAQTISCETLAEERRNVLKLVNRHRLTHSSSSDPGDTETDGRLGRRGSMTVGEASDGGDTETDEDLGRRGSMTVGEASDGKEK